ncbi:carbamoyl phosphate synthase small subunit, partial [Staphylococcus sp. SIMBA_130]
KRVAITSQNHGYTIAPETLEKTELVVTHVAVNDGSIEGVKHKEYAAFSVQYHPEASPGPEDANELFDDFIAMITTFKGEKTYA